MKFINTDLLKVEEIESLIMSKSPNDVADVLTPKLKKYCFIHNDILYIYDLGLFVYDKIESKTKDKELQTIITGYINESIKALSKEKQELLQLKYDKGLGKILKNSFINENNSQIITGLKEKQNLFSGDFYEIHYRNGYIDLKDLKFKQRTQKHYVCNYIDRMYVKSTKQQQDNLLYHLTQIYPKNEDLEAIMFILGSAMTGRAIKEQKILFLLGLGSAGKSTIMKITQMAVEGYLETLETEAFSMSNSNADKTFSTFYNRPTVRIIWTNEPKEDKIDKSKFKGFCEGEMKGKLLWEQGTHNFNHNALPVFTANVMPNIDIDSGVKRRFRGYEHKSEFVTDKSKVDESKHIYLRDRDLLEKIKNGCLLDAWVDLLSVYANKWINGEEIPIPASFQEATSEMIDVNDKFQDFIDSKLEKTNEGSNDRIGKNDMMSLYKQMYPNRHLTPQQLLACLKEKGISYNKELRSKTDGVKGCFIGIKEKDAVEEDNPLDYGFVGKNVVEEEPKVDYKTLYEEAIKKLQELENLLKPPVVVFEEKIEIPENEDDEDGVYLYVPYEYRKEAKKDGLKFDGDRKEWYSLKTNPKYLWCKMMWCQTNFKDSCHGTKLVNSKYDDLVNMFNEDRTELKKKPIEIQKVEKLEILEKTQDDNSFTNTYLDSQKVDIEESDDEEAEALFEKLCKPEREIKSTKSKS